MSGSSRSAVDRYAAFLLSTDYSALPDDVVDACKRYFEDTLAVGIAGARVDSSGQLRSAASRWGSGEAASILGRPERLPTGSAACLNAFQIHCQEFDCLHEGAAVHAMAVLTGALLAVGEERGWTGRDLILGIALGVDVAATLGLASSAGLRFFRPATAGALASAAALARLAAFDERRFRGCLGLAYSQLAGTMQAHVEGSVALPLQVGLAARAAVNSLELTEAGLEGPRDVLEGPFGYFRLFDEGGHLDRALSGLGSVWRVTELSVKPFPTGRAAHGTLDALGRLLDEAPFALSEVERVTTFVPPLVKRLVDRRSRPGMAVNYARLCLPFLVPLFLRDRRIDTTSFGRQTLDDESLLRLGARVEVVDDGNADPNALGPQRIEIRFANGERRSVDIAHTLGSPQNPLDAEQRRGKFEHCLKSAGFDGDELRGIAAMVDDLEALTDLRELMRACRRPR
ncbi:MAG: MmgE/PrpD family protein [Woeseiaceae bacterium]|nr:MmgE/PrpD family protein [Woeseiaceae bacterium]